MINAPLSELKSATPPEHRGKQWQDNPVATSHDRLIDDLTDWLPDDCGHTETIRKALKAMPICGKGGKAPLQNIVNPARVMTLYVGCHKTDCRKCQERKWGERVMRILKQVKEWKDSEYFSYLLNEDEDFKAANKHAAQEYVRARGAKWVWIDVPFNWYNPETGERSTHQINDIGEKFTQYSECVFTIIITNVDMRKCKAVVPWGKQPWGKQNERNELPGILVSMEKCTGRQHISFSHNWVKLRDIKPKEWERKPSINSTDEQDLQAAKETGQLISTAYSGPFRYFNFASKEGADDWFLRISAYQSLHSWNTQNPDDKWELDDYTARVKSQKCRHITGEPPPDDDNDDLDDIDW